MKRLILKLISFSLTLSILISFIGCKKESISTYKTNLTDKHVSSNQGYTLTFSYPGKYEPSINDEKEKITILFTPVSDKGAAWSIRLTLKTQPAIEYSKNKDELKKESKTFEPQDDVYFLTFENGTYSDDAYISIKYIKNPGVSVHALVKGDVLREDVIFIINSISFEIDNNFPTTSSEDTSSYQEPLEEGTILYGGKKVLQRSYFDSTNGFTLQYCLILPLNYDPNKKYPVLLYLHGAGEIGNDNYKHLANMTNAMYDTCPELLTNCIYLAPQTSEWWSLKTDQNGNHTGSLGSAIRLLDHIQNTYSCDENRLYVMGLSMGGIATWSILCNFSDKFAAGVPICGSGAPETAYLLRDVPIWIYHGLLDQTLSHSNSQMMYEAILNAGNKNVHFTTKENVGHNVWRDAAADKELLEWLFSQKLSNR